MHPFKNININTSRLILCAMIWLLSWASLAATPEAKRMTEHAPAKERDAANHSEKPQGTTEQSPLHVLIVQSTDEAASAIERERKSTEHEERDLDAQVRSANAAEKQVILTLGAVILSFLGAVGLFWTINLSRRSVSEATRAVDAANINTASLISAERAYVTISIIAPGVQLQDDDRPIFVRAKVQNFGRTPATVTDTRIWVSIREHGDLLPEEFPYPTRAGEARHTGFLVPTDDFQFEQYFPIGTSSATENTSKRLWLFGHVDYIALAGRYRHGFARLYEPRLNGREINIMAVTEGRYDFDRERKPNEGEDW